MNTNKILFSLPIIIFSIVMTACGGGGGGGGPAPITYTGVSTPANIDVANAEELASGAAELGEFGSAGLADSVNPGSQQNKSGASVLTRAAVKAIKNKLNTGTSLTSSIHNFSDTMQGPCGGSLSTDLDADDVALTLSGAMSFNDYCEDGITIKGQFNLSGTVNASVTLMTFTMSTSSILIRDNASGDVYKYENYVMSIVANLNSSGDITSTTVSISGRFYHPDYGYVVVTTPVAMVFTGNNEWPDSGVMKVTEDGSPPVDSATLTALNSIQYQLDIDLGNDGIIESSTTGNWADL